MAARGSRHGGRGVCGQPSTRASRAGWSASGVPRTGDSSVVGSTAESKVATVAPSDTDACETANSSAASTPEGSKVATVSGPTAAAGGVVCHHVAG
jgi:hypothetical protein